MNVPNLKMFLARIPSCVRKNIYGILFKLILKFHYCKNRLICFEKGTYSENLRATSSYFELWHTIADRVVFGSNKGRIYFSAIDFISSEVTFCIFWISVL